MSRAMRFTLPLPALLLALVLGACGGKTGDGSGPIGGPPKAAEQGAKDADAPKADDASAATDLGFPGFATKNTTRVAGTDPVATAAGVALAVFPGATRAQRPTSVAIVDRRDWRSALAATSLMGAPLHAPILLSDEQQDLPAASASALKQLAPTGAAAAGGAQVIRIGNVPRPAGMKGLDVLGRDPFQIAARIDAQLTSANGGRPTDAVLVVSADDPAYAMPAAGYAAKAGVPILFARRGSVPAETITAIKAHQTPKIYVLGPSGVIGPQVTAQLRKLGTVKRMGGPDPVKNAIAFASYLDGSFGWGVVDPGHGLVFSRTNADPATAAAIAPLSASGSYGPLLLVADPLRLDVPLADYLATIRPGYRNDPVRAVYNRAWVVGDAKAISVATQAQIDSLLEVKPEKLPTS